MRCKYLVEITIDSCKMRLTNIEMKIKYAKKFVLVVSKKAQLFERHKPSSSNLQLLQM
ncbi:hypothetical protein T08_11212 [Trichinella sp. T8]|nr:hypothetical protein T08_11212 [Trichinella sp. T8]